MTQQNQFALLWALGYKRLLPVTPPDAGIREAGKRPGLKGPNGWFGQSIKKFDATEESCRAWHAMGAGVGLKCDGEFIAIDIDSLASKWVAVVRAAAIEHFGPAPIRIGRAPKELLLYRATGEIPYQQIRFDDGGEDGKSGLVEALTGADGTKWFVMHGVHPITKRPYTWPNGTPPADELTKIDARQVTAFFEHLAGVLPAAKGSAASSADRLAIDQANLKGDLDLVAKAVRAMPNDTGRIGYQEWMTMAAALRGACQDDYELGKELFAEWSDKADLGDATESAERVYDSIKPPFGLGADYVYEQAQRLSGGLFSGAERWFEEPDESGPLFPDSSPNAFSGRVFDVLDVGRLFDMPDPKFLIDRHVPEKGVGFLYGDPGTGKSFIALDWALHIAFDRPTWHGDAVAKKPDGCVIYLAGEGASGFKTRVSAWLHRNQIANASSGRFGLIQHSINFMKQEDIITLLDTLKHVVRSPVAMVVVDTVSRSMPGADENTQKEMTLFVKACDLVRDAFNCAVLGVHHAGKKGDMRGSTVLTGAGDFVFKLDRKKGHSVGHLSCEKQKDAPDGWHDAYRFDVVTVGEGKSSLVPIRCDAGSGEGATLTPDVSAAVLSAMRAAWDDGAPWGLRYQAGEMMAARRMTRDFGFDMESAEQILAVWIGSGVVVEEVVSKKSKRRGLKVVGSPPDADGEDGVFG